MDASSEWQRFGPIHERYSPEFFRDKECRESGSGDVKELFFRTRSSSAGKQTAGLGEERSIETARPEKKGETDYQRQINMVNHYVSLLLNQYHPSRLDKKDPISDGCRKLEELGLLEENLENQLGAFDEEIDYDPWRAPGIRLHSVKSALSLAITEKKQEELIENLDRRITEAWKLVSPQVSNYISRLEDPLVLICRKKRLKLF